MRTAYQTDLSDAEWNCLQPHLPAPKTTGRPKLHTTREILNAIFYIVRGGCAWRLLPTYPTTSLGQEDRLPLLPLLASGWDMGEDALSPTQECAGPSEEKPSAQRSHCGLPVGQNNWGGRKRARLGYDGAKKVKGRKRHLLVDTQGLVLEARVHNANVTDREGIKLLLEPSSPDRLPRLSHLWLDAGYTGQEKRGVGWVRSVLGWTAEIVRHPPKPAPEEVMMRWVREWAKEGVDLDPKKFLPLEGSRTFLPRRWVVERTFSWLSQNTGG